jgi:hypothetical protein
MRHRVGNRMEGGADESASRYSSRSGNETLPLIIDLGTIVWRTLDSGGGTVEMLFRTMDRSSTDAGGGTIDTLN